jgi:hypothetical protein
VAAREGLAGPFDGAFDGDAPDARGDAAVRPGRGRPFDAETDIPRAA